MNKRTTIVGLAMAIFAVALSAVLLLRASSAYSELRQPDSNGTSGHVVRASDRSNLWFFTLVVTFGIANVFLARLVILKRRDDGLPTA